MCATSEHQRCRRTVTVKTSQTIWARYILVINIGQLMTDSVRVVCVLCLKVIRCYLHDLHKIEWRSCHMPAAVPAVLVPGLDLSVAELQRSRQLHPVLDTQVLLLLEASLQATQLLVAEGCPSLPRFFQAAGGLRGSATTWWGPVMSQKVRGQLSTAVKTCFFGGGGVQGNILSLQRIIFV